MINLWMETEVCRSGDGRAEDLPAEGRQRQPHEVFFCGDCGTYLWSRYHGAPGDVLFVRAGTLDDSRKRSRPDVHIFTKSKVCRGWIFRKDVPAFKTFYKLDEVADRKPAPDWPQSAGPGLAASLLPT